MIDLRMLLAALAVWLAAWSLTGRGSSWSGATTVIAAVVVVMMGISLAALSVWAARSSNGRNPVSTVPHGVSMNSAIAHSFLVAACVLGVTVSTYVQLAARAPLVHLAEHRVAATLTGTVASQPEALSFRPGHKQSRWILAARAVDAQRVQSETRARVQVLSQTPPQYGATVTVSGALKTTNPGAPETARLTTTTMREVRPPPWVLRVLDIHRTALLDITDPLSPQARGLVPGSAIGDTSRLPKELAEEMRTTGLSHITAVSGGHFAIVVAVLSALCTKVRIPRIGRIAVITILSGAFVLLVRPEPAVLRAAVMTAFALTGLAMGRPAQSFPALAASVIGLLVVDPWLSRSFGFALSAAATAGLVLFAAPLSARLAPWIGDVAAYALAVPIAAQAACGPLLVLLDPSVSTMSVLANVLAAPALLPATVLGLVATVLAPGFPAIAGIVVRAASAATWWIAKVAHGGAAFPVASVPWLGGAVGALLLAVLTAVALWGVLRCEPSVGWSESWRAQLRSRLKKVPMSRQAHPGLTRSQVVSVVAAAIVLGFIVVLAVPRLSQLGAWPEDGLVVACDVGQGDALAVRTGPTSAVVVDVGPQGGAADRCLDRFGVTTVDLLVLSHFHADHVGGLRRVLDGRRVVASMVTPVHDPPSGASATEALLASVGIPVREAHAGDRGRAGGVAWEVLQAAGGQTPREVGANDASVALAVYTPDVDVLLLGDLEAEGQAALVAELRRRGEGEFDVVKVAHHGSAVQSRELAEVTSPIVALFSVGRENEYGHPTDEALNLYAGVGAVLLRTDQCGTIVLVVRDGGMGVAGC